VTAGSSVPDTWDGDLVRAEVSTGSEETPPIALAIVRNATFTDIVAARQANLDFTVVDKKAAEETAPSKVEQIKLVLESAASVVAKEGLENEFILVKRDDAATGESIPWMVQIANARAVKSAVNDDPSWMIYGNEYWESEIAGLLESEQTPSNRVHGGVVRVRRGTAVKDLVVR